MAKQLKGVAGASDPKGYIPGAELVLFTPGVALGKHIYDALRDGRPAVSPSDPLSFAVKESVSSAGGHTLTLVCSNLGPHGVYLEDVRLSDPTKLHASTRLVIAKGGIELGSSKPSSVPIGLPVLVPSGGHVTFEVSLSPFGTARMEKKPFGKLAISYTVLGLIGGRRDKTVEFAVRSESTPEMTR